jgi:pyridoxamine 5'-phosphate oxidase
MDIGDLDSDPERQIAKWLEEAAQAGAEIPEAMGLATATSDGEPSLRIVMLRGIGGGLVFFTDGESQKAVELMANPHAAAVLHWVVPLHRQVRVSGPVAHVSDAESDAYWRTRPIESQLTAAASHQSTVIRGREVLEQSVEEIVRHIGPGEVPRPQRWGGWRIEPQMVEFWQERPGRAHDRIRYRRSGSAWSAERLSP